MLNGGLQSLDGGLVHRFTPGEEEGYTTDAVNFDGTNDALSIAGEPTGMSDGKDVLFSCWVKKAADGSFQILFNFGGSVQQVTYFTSGNKLVTQWRGVGGGGILGTWTSNTTINVASGWTHILYAIDAANTTFQCYFDDVADSASYSVTNNVIDWTLTNYRIGNYYNGSLKLNGDLADFYVTNEYLDLSVESNRRKFIDASGKPVDLGSDGSTPTGTAALFFHKADAVTPDNIRLNVGSSDDYVVTGAFTNASSSPSD